VNSSPETRASASEGEGASANATDAQQSFVEPPAEGPPTALVKLHELGLLGQAELAKLGAWHVSHPDEAHLGRFVEDAGKIATTVLEKVPNKATMVELRARLTAGAQSLLREHGPKSPRKARERRLRAAS
jgi:hypothetical protein